MDDSTIWLLIILGIGALLWISAKISEAISDRRQREEQIRRAYEDQRLRAELPEFHFSKEKEDIQSIVPRFDFKTGYRCPKCGGLLVRRNGKYGRFLGCSNYPKCRYTRSI
ncbi:MAG TPA: hypothetical protein G4O12_02715 [Dehalococcoidia bacterium]|nr:hypothetical protein [Dehalococcoidia bacterium]